MSWYSFSPYVTVAERRSKALKAAQKMNKGGRTLSPIELQGRTIAGTFWGKAWCTNLEAYSDYSNRLPRGRSYVRNGSVIDLQIASGKITALVQGSSLYKITISIRSLPPARWNQFKAAAAGKITNLLDLLQGRLGKELLAEMTANDRGLFPAPKEIALDCSCPDSAGMCKHLAAVLYGVGARLDTKPELFFTLRGVEMEELITAASATAAAPVTDATSAESNLAAANLSEIFGVEIETAVAPAPPAKPVRYTKQKSGAKPAARRKAENSKRPSKPCRKPAPNPKGIAASSQG